MEGKRPEFTRANDINLTTTKFEFFEMVGTPESELDRAFENHLIFIRSYLAKTTNRHEKIRLEK